ncbi:hypothetical protein B0T10DRAFT_568812 [Thelonectria olida]|uniref:Hydrophobin n=1 Tax=Thelonectria olida TaxID=1576542 RepID=A0A9P9AH20_9HYPO|nr:hypothetical protein B0T10DRAFT_568812 [Thelonectria olida]
MQFSTVLSVLSTALAVSAAPEVYARGGKKDICCSGLLNCVIAVGNVCNNGDVHYKCDTDVDTGKVILGVNALNCVKVL